LQGSLTFQTRCVASLFPAILTEAASVINVIVAGHSITSEGINNL
jgi:hypothetical protein